MAARKKPRKRAKKSTAIGRPLKLTKALTKKVCEHVSAGNYYVTACAAVGISYASFKSWMAQGRADEEAGKASPYLAFLAALTRASAIGEAELVKAVSDQVGRDWRSGIEILKRRHPEHWAAKQDVRVSGGTDNTVRIEVVHTRDWRRMDTGEDEDTALVDGAIDAVVIEAGKEATALVGAPGKDSADAPISAPPRKSLPPIHGSHAVESPSVESVLERSSSDTQE